MPPTTACRRLRASRPSVNSRPRKKSRKTIPSWATNSVTSDGWISAEHLRLVRAEQQAGEQVGGDRREAEAARDQAEHAEHADGDGELGERHCRLSFLAAPVARYALDRNGPAVASPFFLVQLSDFHIGADWLAAIRWPGSRRRSSRSEPCSPQPDAVLVTGDIAHHASDAEYEQVLELLALLRVPLYVLPGNHDDRRSLHRHFEVPGADGEPVQYSADLGDLRLIAIDTTRPGEDPGALDAARLGWLDEELATAPKTPTLLAMHHPPC